MKTTTKMIAAGLIAASVMTLGLTSVSANEAVTNEIDFDSNITFSEIKTITIEGLKLDLENVEDADAKTQIESSIQALSATKTEEEFYKMLDVEDEKISKLYVADENEEVTETEIDVDLKDVDFDKMLDLSFEEEKALIVKDLETEGAKSDVIEAVKNAKTDEEIDAVFTKMLDADVK